MNIQKRLFAGILAVALCVSAIIYNPHEVHAEENWPSSISTGSSCAIVMDYDTGTVLYEKNATTAMYPASITKVLTALLVIENADLDEIVTFSADAVTKNEGEGSNIARDFDEQMTVEECLYAVLLESANECSYALAEHVAGSAEAFADMMNARAAELGCVNTHFVTVNGLHDANHYTCCYDMALISREAYKNETFRRITATKAYDIPPTNKHDEITYLRNDNSMLATYKTAKYLYEYCTGGKPGYTPEAGFTQVEYAQKDGMTLVAVVMGAAAGVQYEDCIDMFDYCFDNYRLWNISENETSLNTEDESFFSSDATMFNSSTSLVGLDTKACIILPATEDFSAAHVTIDYNSGGEDVAGVISYTYAGREVGKAEILIRSLDETTFQYPSETAGADLEEEVHISWKTVVKWIFIVILILILLIVIRYFQVNFYIMRNRRRRKRKAKRRAQMTQDSTNTNISFRKKRR